MAIAIAALLAAAAVGWAVSLRDTWGTRVPDLDPPALEAKLMELLGAVYAAFDEEDEAAIYDRLEAAAAGGVVAELYLQRRAAQVADHVEAGESDILSVEPVRIHSQAVPNEQAYRIDAVWRVVGRVSHRTHMHERISLYAADLVLAPVDGAWKITQLTLIDVDRDTGLDFRGGE